MDDTQSAERAQAYWQKVVARYDDVGIDGLSDAERVYFLVRIADAEVNNGGFHAICYNPTGDYGARFAFAFASIGAVEKTRLFEELNDVFGDGGLPAKYLERNAAHSELTASQISTIEDLDARYFSDPDDVDDLLQRWVDAKGICE